MVPVEILGTYVPRECPDCGETVVVEMTTMGGTTYAEDYFVDEVLPGLDIERIDHPSGEAYIYGDPDTVGIIEHDD
jgi:hypothetical protein